MTNAHASFPQEHCICGTAIATTNTAKCATFTKYFAGEPFHGHVGQRPCPFRYRPSTASDDPGQHTEQHIRTPHSSSKGGGLLITT